MHHASQPDIVVVGGFGSGKTIGMAFSAITWATVMPNFKFLNVAPTGWQSKQMYDALIGWMGGTLFEERFVWKRVEKPYPKIVIRYSVMKGKRIIPCVSTLEFMSGSDDAQRIKTWEGDWINIDQAEQVEDLSEAVISLGTRLRGNVPDPFSEDGKRNRMGRLSMLANSEDNPELWGFFDLAEAYPETNYSVQVATYSNKNLTERQIEDFRRRIKDPDKFAQHLEGKRPLGRGIEFSGEMVSVCLDRSLDDLMEARLAMGDPEFIREETQEAGVVLWQMPRDQTRTYVVVGDAGQGSPPLRNAPVVMVFDVTEYPIGKISLRAFWWGEGRGKYEPWISKMLEWREYYGCINSAYDATGGQKVHSETSFKDFDDIVPVDMGGTSLIKAQYIVNLKLLMSKGKLAFPNGIIGIKHQLLKYRLPDTKIAQDIVATILVLMGYLRWAGLDDDQPEPEPVMELTPRRRDSRRWLGDRYSRKLDRRW